MNVIKLVSQLYLLINLLPSIGASKSNSNGLRRATATKSKNCGTLRLQYETSELVDTPNAVGKTQYVQVTDPESNCLPGLFTMSITDIPVPKGAAFGNATNACLFNAAINLGFNGFTNAYDDMINIQGSCLSETNAVVGGIGKYENAKGTQTFESGSLDGTIAVVIDYCAE